MLCIIELIRIGNDVFVDEISLVEEVFIGALFNEEEQLVKTIFRCGISCKLMKVAHQLREEYHPAL